MLALQVSSQRWGLLLDHRFAVRISTNLTLALALVLAGLLAPGVALLHAQGPEAEATADPTRPQLHLPYPGGVSYKVTCGYSCYQHHGSMQYAVDFDVPENGPVTAAADGTVMAVTWELGLPLDLNLGDALIVYIDHGQGWFTRYVHLSGITVEVGQEVRAGQVIGYGGDTGASGAHLHFELKRGESLHSPSQPIDDLFGGPPEAGKSYLSDNAELGEATEVPTVEPPSLPTPAVPMAGLLVPTPTLEQPPPASASLSRDTRSVTGPYPRVSAGLVLSPTAVAAGETVTATFTVRNDGSESVHFAILGVGSRGPNGELTSDALFFERNVTIHPNDEHRFERKRTIKASGDLELFVFALSEDNHLLSIPAAAPEIVISSSLRVTADEHRLFLPALIRPAPDD